MAWSLPWRKSPDAHAASSACDDTADGWGEYLRALWQAGLPEPGAGAFARKPASLKEVERSEVMAALERNGFVQYKAADELGLTPRQMGYRVRKYGLEEAIARGENRVLLVMATGTGKTYTAFQIIWRLWKSGAKKRILFLVDRNILADQMAFLKTQLPKKHPCSPRFGQSRPHETRIVR